MDASVTIHPKAPAPAPDESAARLLPNVPPLIQTPAGLALLELQGAFNLPAPEQPDEDDEDDNNDKDTPPQPISIGRIEFPDYDAAAAAADPKQTAWMRRVQFYVGPNQRLTGEVKKLPRPVAIVRRRRGGGGDGKTEQEEEGGDTDLEVVEVIHYKLLFSSRPEPMTESGPV